MSFNEIARLTIENDKLRAELAAAKARIEAAYKEGWWDSSDRPSHTPEQAEKDWLDSDAALNGGGDE